MTIKVDPRGVLYSDMYCLRCDEEGPHLLAYEDGEQDVFRCGRCFASFTDHENAGPIPSTWSPESRPKD